jgi:hypothetical protein
MNWQDLLPAEARHVIAFCQAAASRTRGDEGEIGIIGAIILVVGFAVAAGILVSAIEGKLSGWIHKIPG